MAEKIIAQYELDTTKFRQQLSGLLKGLDEIEKEGKIAGQETEKSFDKAGKSADTAKGKVNQLGNSFESIGSIAKKASLAFAGLFAVDKLVSQVGNAIDTIKTFDQSIQDLSAITGASGADLERYKDAAIEMGKGVVGGASATVEAFKLIGSAKPELLASADSLIEVTDAAITLSKAAGMDLPSAATALTDAMNQFGAPAEEAGRFINVLAAGSKFGAAEIPQVTEALLSFGAAAKTSNISIEESTALIETLAEKGLKGAEAGTAIRNVLLKIGAPDALPKDAQQAMEDLGVSFDDLTNKEKPLSERFEALKPLMKDNAAMIKVFGTENVVAATNILSNTERLKELTGQVSGTNTAYEQAAVRSLTLNEAFNRLKESYNALILQFNEGIGVSGMLSGAIVFLANNLGTILKTIALAAQAFVTYKVVTLAVANAQKIAQMASAAYRVSSIALAGAKATLTGNTMRAAAAQRALGLSFAATPWGFIITAITTVASGLLMFSSSAEEASDSQKKLDESMAAANEKMKQQEERSGRLSDLLTKFNANSASLSISELKQAIQDANAQLEDTPIVGQRFVDNLQSQRFEIDQTTGKLVEVTNAEIVYKETQEEANARQASYIAGLKAKKAALEAQLASQEGNINNHKKEITVLQKVQDELKNITDRITKQILIGGPIQQKDIDRLEFLNGKLDNLKSRLDEIKKQTSTEPITLEFEGVQNVDALTSSIDNAVAGSVEKSTIMLEQLRADFAQTGEEITVDFEEQMKEVGDALGKVGEGFNMIAGIVSQVQERQRDEITQTYDEQIRAIENSTLSEEEKSKRIEALKKKEAQDLYQLQLKQFQINKAISIVQAIINTASGVVAQLQAGPAGIALAAIAAAAGAAQIALIASQQPPPPPAFAEGTDFVQRGRNKAGVDTIPAYLNEGEAVIPTDRNKAYPGMAKAWISGSLDDYIVRNFVAPKLIEMERKAERRMADSFAASLKGDGFDDARLLMATSEGNLYLKTIAKEMKNKPKKRTAW